MLGLTAHEFRPDAGSENGIVEWVGKLDQQTLDSTCPKNGLVLALANNAAQSVKASGQYGDATEFGNKVHNHINREMKDKYQNEDFRSELSLVPNVLANSKNKLRVRLDIFEHIRSTETVCVYDHKTGLEQLTFGRAMELIGAAVNLYPLLKRLIMIQVKTDP